MTVSLVMVPVMAVGCVGELAAVGVVVLDDLLYAGAAGVYFRRLRLDVALFPEKRREYDRKRHQYLDRVLSEVLTDAQDVVVVGTHPADVDLYEFDRVLAIDLSVSGMRALSVAVHGDPMVSYLEYWSVLRAVGNSVDDTCTLFSVDDIIPTLVREFPNRKAVAAVVTPHRQREHLAFVLRDQLDASVWLEEELRVEVGKHNQFLVADFDYLRVVKPAWRDAVVRLLGPAPSVASVVRLPWYVVDMGAVHSLCYRKDASGKPAVSMRGLSMVEFVRTRLSTVLNTRELIGTWVGALLCDGVTAVDTYRAAGSSVLSGSVGSEQGVISADIVSKVVPREYLWMFSAVPGYVAGEWQGQRAVDGVPKPDPLKEPLMALAFMYQQYRHDLVLSAEVVMLVYRLHSCAFGAKLVSELYWHAVDVLTEGPCVGVFNDALTCLLPGYTYLYNFPPRSRFDALTDARMNPNASRLLAVAKVGHVKDSILSVNDVVTDHTRMRLLAGAVSVDGVNELVVGSAQRVGKGYCYLVLYEPAHRALVSSELGSYPKFADVLHGHHRALWRVGAPSSVYVTEGVVDGRLTLHMSEQAVGVTLAEYLAHVEHNDSGVVARSFVVGAESDDICTAGPVFVAMIIGWTIVGVLFVGFFMKLIYSRCMGPTKLGGYGGYR